MASSRLKFDRKGAFELPDPDDLIDALDRVAEEYTDYMAEQASDNAPVDTGALANSILASVEKEAPMTYLFGSHLPYAQRQEYEHRTKKAYFRRAIWQYQEAYGDAILRALERRWTK